MFNWNDEQQQPWPGGQHQTHPSKPRHPESYAWDRRLPQVGDAIWAEFNESEDHIVPYPKGAEDSMIRKDNEEEAASIAGVTEHSAGVQTELHAGVQTGLQGMEKQTANQTSAHFSTTRIDMECWPDLPSLNPTLDRNYSDDNVASTYLDFNAEPSLQKVTGNATGQLDGESEVFGNDQEEKSNSFLDCDWDNIGDFDDFDHLFSSSDSIFGNEIVTNDSDFLCASSNLMDNAVQSILIPQLPLNKQPSCDRGPSSLLSKEISSGVTKRENKVEVQKRPVRSRRKPEERGKNKICSTSGFSQSKVENPSTNLQDPMQPVQTPQYALFQDSKKIGQVQHANQFMFPGYGYPAYPFPNIPLVSKIQAEGYQTKPAGTSYQTLEDSPKQSSSIETSQDIASRPLTMTPQEKIEKLRRRQQMQALMAIRQQQQQFGQEGSGSDTMVSQAYSPRNKNPDSLGSSIVIDENTYRVFLPEMVPTNHDLVHRSAISDDPFVEEKIYYQLQDALGKLDTKTRLCIRDSLLRLAHSATERQVDGDRSSTNKTNKDKDEASENDASTRRTSSPSKEAETTTNPIDRIVAHLLFHRHCSKVATATKEEIISSIPMILEPEPKVLGTPRVPSEDHRDEQEIVL